MVSSNTNENCDDKSDGVPIVEVDLTANSTEEDNHEVSVVTRRSSHSLRKQDRNEADNKIPGALDNLARLFDRILFAELITEDNEWTAYAG